MPDKQNFNAVIEPVVMSNRKGRNGMSDNGIGTTLTSQEKERPLIAMNIVRRLTPMECERLQGFPDGWTLIGEPAEEEVKDYDIAYDEEGNEVGRTFAGTHIETVYYYTDSNGKRKKCADSARYKALGNSIALPFWEWMAKRMTKFLPEGATMASLFDGIGGFPLAYQRAGVEPVWASEIEPFPIAVTKVHFPEPTNEIQEDT